MPRKTKEQNKLESNKKETKKTNKSPTTDKRTTTKKATPINPSTISKTSTTKKSVGKKTNASKKKTSSPVKTTTAKKESSSTRKTATKKATKKTSKKKVEVVEYYDLPYRYNQTVVKVLAQTPTNLFIYWDISEKDRKNFEKYYGENFFETTKPVLIIYNDTLNYKFEVEINDFANSWYLHVSDSKCDYRVELGRRPIEKSDQLKDDYIYVSTSNEIESPNDKILFDKNQEMVYFRNVKTGTKTGKSITNLSFMRNMGKIYYIYDLYKEIYKTENVEGIYDASNPSS